METIQAHRYVCPNVIQAWLTITIPLIKRDSVNDLLSAKNEIVYPILRNPEERGLINVHRERALLITSFLFSIRSFAAPKPLLIRW